MKPSTAIHAHRDHVLDVLKRRQLHNPRLFGSAARREDTEVSDLDILVDAPSGTSLFDLAAAEIELECILQCRVEILTEAFLAPDIRTRVAIDVVPLS